jgi:hypothetical protein
MKMQWLAYSMACGNIMGLVDMGIPSPTTRSCEFFIAFSWSFHPCLVRVLDGMMKRLGIVAMMSVLETSICVLKLFRILCYWSALQCHEYNVTADDW